MFAKLEVLGVETVVAVHFLVAVLLVGLVCGSIERVLKVSPVACYHLVVGVGKALGILVVGEGRNQRVAIELCLFVVLQASVEQEEVVVCLGAFLSLGEVPQQSHQQSKSIGIVLYLLHHLHSAFEQCCLHQFVGCFHLFRCQGNLLDIVFTLMGVVGKRVANALFFLVELGLACCFYGIRVLVVVVFLEFIVCHNGLVRAAPVVLVLAVAPPALELLFSGHHGLGVIEIPHSLVGGHGAGWRGVRLLLCLVLGVAARVGIIIGCIRRSSFLCLLLFFLLKGLNNSVDGCKAFRLGHLRQGLQTVLQLYHSQWGCGLVEGLRPLCRLLVGLVFLVEDAYAGGIGALGVNIVFLLPVNLRQAQEQYCLGNTVASALLGSLLVGCNAVHSVADIQVDVADGIVNLVEIVLVFLVLCHTKQAFYHLLVLRAGHHLRLQDAGIERQFVGRIAADNLRERLVCLIVLSQFALQLSEQEVQACALHLVRGML